MSHAPFTWAGFRRGARDGVPLALSIFAYGLGFGGIIPAYVLAVRQYFPAAEAAWRVPALLFVSASGMGAGAWLAGTIYDRVGYYAAAWWVGIAFNLVQLALVGFLVGAMGPSSVIHFAPMWITFGLGMLTLILARADRDANP